jgi:hypothetical protein
MVSVSSFQKKKIQERETVVVFNFKLSPAHQGIFGDILLGQRAKTEDQDELRPIYYCLVLLVLARLCMLSMVVLTHASI